MNARRGTLAVWTGIAGALLAVLVFVLVAVFASDDPVLLVIAGANAVLFLNAGAWFAFRGNQLRKLPDQPAETDASSASSRA